MLLAKDKYLVNNVKAENGKWAFQIFLTYRQITLMWSSLHNHIGIISYSFNICCVQNYLEFHLLISYPTPFHDAKILAYLFERLICCAYTCLLYVIRIYKNELRPRMCNIENRWTPENSLRSENETYKSHRYYVTTDNAKRCVIDRMKKICIKTKTTPKPHRHLDLHTPHTHTPIPLPRSPHSTCRTTELLEFSFPKHSLEKG